MEYKVGQCVFFNWTDNFCSKVITYYNNQKYGKSLATHVGVILEVDGDDILIGESIDRGFAILPYHSSFLDRHREMGDVIIGEPKEELDLDILIESAHKYEGTPYGWLDILCIGIHFYTGLSIDLTGAKRIICSEAVAKLYYDASEKVIDFQLEYDKHISLIDPMNILDSNQIKILNYP